MALGKVQVQPRLLGGVIGVIDFDPVQPRGRELPNQAIELGAARYVNIKTGRVGGLTNGIAIHNLCRGAGVPCWVGGMLESAVGGSHNLALATLDNFTYPADVFPSSRFYAPDLAGPEVVLSGPSQITARDVPGCGAEPVPERLEAMTAEHAAIVPG